MIYKSQIKLITASQASDMLDKLADTDTPGEDLPEGLFIWEEGRYWVAMDNLDGYAWVEQFNNRYDAEHWLLGW